MTDRHDHSPSIGKEGRKVRDRFKHLKRDQKHATSPGRLATRGGPLPAPISAFPSPEHYHLCYTYDGMAFPHLALAFPSTRSAYVEIARLGTESEPNTEWYDDGRIMIETTIHGRSGLFRLILHVAACMNKQCGRTASPLIVPHRARL